ncbi:hypothetical protein VIBNISOn1_190014 [Vibrio nigripulchritudo SOn1]|uniref:Bacterial virulence protein VirB8 domain-containing protein n=1 Tax=Vibrio nigripulchritudo SOn1 TaxID=1238450 RepID=A0AAV2VQH8_9VIBR|nr:hypothetical protein [Vibrio nigripulchritudo]CCO46795.1 hypothetical protein VIBNISOn1_190014 [Vibrio nigripulchritudo SOn1]
MGKRPNQAELINDAIAEHIKSIVRRSGTGMLLFATFVTTAFAVMYFITRIQWQESSGKFLVPSENGRIVSQAIIDPLHAFDDYVATIQNHVSLELSEQLNFTTTSFKNTLKLLDKEHGTYKADVLANMRNYKILEAISDPEKIRAVKFSIIDTPLLVDGESDGVSLAQLYEQTELRPINSIILDKAQVEVFARISLRDKNKEVRTYKIRFYVTLTGTSRSSWRMQSMAGWQS